MLIVKPYQRPQTLRGFDGESGYEVSPGESFGITLTTLLNQTDSIEGKAHEENIITETCGAWRIVAGGEFAGERKYRNLQR